MRVEGRAWVFGDDMSTDLMYPQVAYAMSRPEAAQQVFEAIRPGWAAGVRAGDIIVGGRNFGMGSARPVAVLLKTLGIAGCAAESFASIFLRNCVNFALPVLPCPTVTRVVSEGDLIRLDFAAGLVRNLSTGVEIETAALPGPLREIIEAGGVIANLEARGLIEAVPAGKPPLTKGST